MVVPMRIGFAIISWNAADTLQACLDSIFACKGFVADVIVVDNGSTDGTDALLDRQDPPSAHRLETVRNSRNLGTTVPRNAAIRMLLARKAECICVLDADTVVGESAVLGLVRELEKNVDVGIVGPSLRNSAGVVQMNARRFPTLPEKFLKAFPFRAAERLGVSMERADGEGARDVDYLMSACWMVRPEVFARAGFLDERIFYAPEDAEFCLRVWRSGYRVRFCPEHCIIHEWRRLSRRGFFTRHNFEHLKGLLRLFLRHRYCLSASGLRQPPSSLSTFDAFKRLDLAGGIEISSEDLRKLQRTLLDILSDFAAVCEGLGVDYQLGGGTALGAVRHGGFIPWDDDVDVNLARRDWPRVRAAFRERYADRYAVCEPGDPRSWRFAFARIRMRGTSVITRDDLVAMPEHPGAGIDVFFLENAFDNPCLRLLQGFVCQALGFLYSCRKAFAERTWHRRWGVRGAAFALKRMIGLFLAFLPLGTWTMLWHRWNGICGNGRSRFVTFPVGRRHFFGELAQREDVLPGRPIDFEGRCFRCNARIDDYLVRLYGPDYLTPPPPSCREKHVFFPPFRPEPDNLV